MNEEDNENFIMQKSECIESQHSRSSTITSTSKSKLKTLNINLTSKVILNYPPS